MNLQIAYRLMGMMIIMGIFVGSFFSIKALADEVLTTTITVEVFHLCTGKVGEPASNCDLDNKGVITDPPIKCKKGDTDYGCGDNGYPFNENPVQLSLTEYIQNVLPGEVTAGYDPYEFLKAQAVAAKSYAHFRSNGGTTIINNSIAYQLYIPGSAHARTNQAIADMDGVVLRYEGQIINALFSSDHGSASLYTNNGKQPYLKPVYDWAVTVKQKYKGHGWGLVQESAINYARGTMPDGSTIPPWDYCQILAHFYTGVSFECRTTTTPTASRYRFNLLYFSPKDTTAWDNWHNDPVAWPRNSLQDVWFILQNIGTDTITLSDCSQPYEDRTVAISGHWYEYDSNQPFGSLVNFEGNRTRLCQYYSDGVWQTQLAPGNTYPLHPELDELAYHNFFIPDDANITVGQLYRFMPDLELRSPHPITWTTQLHPQLNPYNPHWSVQNPLIRITSGSNNPPQEPEIIAQSHPSGVWLNKATVNIDWRNDSSVAYYSYAWEQDGTFTKWQDTTQSEVTTQRGNGKHTFHLQAIGSNGQVSDKVQLNSILIDLITPTVTFVPSLAVITNPLATDISFSWFSDADGQAPLTFDIAYATAPQKAEPPPTPLDPNLIGLISTTLSLSELGLTLTANTTYYMWVRGHDEAGNISEWLEQQISYQPAPLLNVKPNQILLTTLTTNITPITLPLSIINEGGGHLVWQATVPFSHTQLSHYTGLATSTLLLTITHPVTVGNYYYPITFTGPLTSYNSPYLLPIRVRVMTAIYPLYLPILFKK